MPVLKDRAIKSAGGLTEFKRQSERYSDDLRYLESKKPDLVKTHDKEWVAIYNASLVDYNKSLPELIKALGKKGIPEEEALIQFISSENILTLYAR
ncbi:MAG: hypothetical protein KAW90_07855 [Dehalococcoidales bacterium]|nr:hypothetical protein [Dehalococcoidales bacterium]